MIAVALVAWLAVPATSLAAEVDVNETDRPPNRAVLKFEGDDGENNEVTLSYAGNDGEFIEIEIRDDGAALDPGQGCDGGGAVGEPVVCALHKPVFVPTFTLCPGGCPEIDFERTAFELSWSSGVVVRLGDAEDSFDAGEFEGRFSGEIPFRVYGGSGRDEIVTGAAEDTIDPGNGRDDVRGGPGNDRVVASYAIDGSDEFDLEEGRFDMATYALRATPVTLRGTSAGGQDENDTLESVEYVIGGLAGDMLFGRTDYQAIEGGPGDDLLVGGGSDDRLIGSGGNDQLFGNSGPDRLVGGDGDDVAIGGDGSDIVLEKSGETRDDELSPLATEPITLSAVDFRGATSGADVAVGGGGDDNLNLGPDRDLAEGGPGNDSIHGEEAADRLAGGVGDDLVAGEAGPDRMWGGSGSDALLAGHMDEHPYVSPRSVDGWSDRVDCGLDRDRALVNRWDAFARCEQARRVKLAWFGPVKRRPRSGIARMTVTVSSPGRLAILGGGIANVVSTVGDPRLVGPYSAILPVRARGNALRELQQRGHAETSFAVRYRPRGGVARTDRRRLHLVFQGK